ncbi:MAG: insulinase family protein [Gammaproteobacteria bacterium]|nr:insulinase family protein [Gammaproteobacteria bacterium]
MAQDRTAPETHSTFEWLRSEAIDSLNVVVEEYRHKKTGAMHYHLQADNNENVFLVGLRTVPTDSTGVAHMLEHTALCGSEKYPVRDPFFMMIRRSLNTFMNAFTSSDWTAYPFASQNRKDFNNLLDVYLDAVFFSRLDELDFAQEGHRVEFEEAANPDSDLVYKGVVFNEMKGAMSSPVSTLWQTVSKHLFPSTTYHFNSGGEPERIPDLSYEELKAFYRVHYHPSNAIFMTYGDISAVEHQSKFEAQVLHRFEPLDREISVGLEERYHAPLVVEENYAFDEPDSENKTHIVLGWLLGESIDLQAQMNAHLLSGVLLDDGASPLRHALESSDLGSAPSPLCGLEESNREMSFVCGIEGSSPEKAAELEQLVFQVLFEVAENGLPQERVEAVLHQLEMSQREVGGGSYPYGLQLILDGLSSAIHRGDPVAAMNLDPVLAKLREQIQDPDFIKGLVKSLLLENQHRVRLSLKPDGGLSARRDAAEAARLAQIKAAMNDAEKQAVVEQAAALEARQQMQDDMSILPKVGLEDVPAEIATPVGDVRSWGEQPATLYQQGTNGLVYQQVIFELPHLSPAELQLLPYYSSCLTELGVGENSYLETQAEQSSVSGGIGSNATVSGAVDDVNAIKGYFMLSSKALNRNNRALAELLSSTVKQARFDELDRIRELIAQDRTRAERSVTGQGHALAMIAASSGLSASAALSHQQRGLAGIQALKALDDSLNERANLEALAGQFKTLHSELTAQPRQFLLVAEAEQMELLQHEVAEVWNAVDLPSKAAKPFSLPFEPKQVKQIWTTGTQVNFCAKAYPTVAVDHPDAPALGVLGGFLRNGYLHRAIREQGGAYGGGASHDPSAAAFRFFSYRDPRLDETLADFDKAVEWLLNEEHGDDALEEAILGVIGGLDKPSSPSGEAKKAFHQALFDRTPEQRQRYRNGVLRVSIADLQRVAKTYLKPELASVAVITSAANVEQFGDRGMTVMAL